MHKTAIEYVNPLIGTNSKKEFSHGNIYPQISLPFGMSCWTPQTGGLHDGWIYQYDKNKINGFKLSHQPSPWIGDYGDFALMPAILENQNIAIFQEERATSFKHTNEEAHPYHYSVLLENNIKVEIVPTERCGVFKFSYPDLKKNQRAVFILDNWSCGNVFLANDNVITGEAKHNSGGIPDNFACYFAIRSNSQVKILQSKNGAYAFELDLNDTTTVELYIGTSFVSIEQARLNLSREVINKSFKILIESAFNKWNERLERIKIEGASEAQLKTFYSCFYRAQLYPRVFFELDEDNNIIHYSPYNGNIEKGKLFTDNGPWDTYRTIYPFYSFMFPELDGEMLNSWVKAYKEGGWFPKWASPGYRECMIGTPIVNMMADAVYKGIKNFDIESGYKSAIKDAEDESGGAGFGKAGLMQYKQLGYVPMLEVKESCSRTLEFSFNDFNLAMFAKYLGHDKDSKKYLTRSKNYKNVFDPNDKFMKGRYKDNNWEKNFDQVKWGGCGGEFGGPYTEGNSWHYTFAVPFDPKGLIELIGGDEEFIKKLDQLLDPENNKFDNEYYGFDIHEMLEMVACNMGQYQHSNQPVHHLLYLYNYAGAPWKAAPHLRQVMNTLYNYNENGFCGDEDNGEMAAWYIMSAMGFYPVCPGSSIPRYEIGTPLFDKVTLKFENEKTLEITAQNNSEKNIYVQSLEINGNPVNRSWIKHEELINGGTIKFLMGNTPNKDFGQKENQRPPSFI